MKITREEVTIEILELLLKLSSILEHDKSQIYVDDPSKMLPSMYIRYRRICAYFEFLDIEIKDLKQFYNLEFIYDYNNYKFSNEVIPTINSVLEGNFKIENINKRSLKFMTLRIINFRRDYIRILENFFGGVRLMGSPSVEERVSKAFVIESIKDIDDLVERLNKVITYLLFPQIKEFELDILIDKCNFPTEDYRALEKKELEDYYSGI